MWHKRREETEMQLINGCIENDRKSQERLYRRYFDLMYSICGRYSRDESEALSILNDGFLRIFKNIGSYRNDGSFEGWLRKIMYRAVADHFRLKANNISFLLPDEQMTAFIRQEESTDQLFIEDLMQYIDMLPSSSSKVLIMYAIEGYTHKEIGNIMNISENTSKWHLSNARQLLREKLCRHYQISQKTI